jgi:thioredoxin-related protein
MVILYLVFLPLGLNLNFGSPHQTDIITTNATANVTANTTKVANKTATATPVPKHNYTLIFVTEQGCPYCDQMRPLITAWVQGKPRLTFNEVEGGYGVRAFPTSILIDSMTNTELHRFVGVFDTSELNAYYK